MVDVFRTLDRIGEGRGSSGVPEWLSTHPSPANRVQLITARIAQMGVAGHGTVGRDELLRHLDGLVYGTNPREGWFGEDGVFHHPDMAFRVRFPKGWKGVNQRTVVGAIAPEQDGMLQLTLAPESTPDAAARAFLSGGDMQSTAPRSAKIGGLPAVTADFAVPTQQGAIRGAAAFVAHGDHVFQLVGVAPQSRFAAHESALRAALASFGRETSAAVLAVEPWRIALVTPSRAMSADAFAKAYPGPASAEELALMNQIPEGGSYAAGVRVKRVVGKALP
jgi:predicted Zn-dependent protease